MAAAVDDEGATDVMLSPLAEGAMELDAVTPLPAVDAGAKSGSV